MYKYDLISLQLICLSDQSMELIPGLPGLVSLLSVQKHGNGGILIAKSTLEVDQSVIPWYKGISNSRRLIFCALNAKTTSACHYSNIWSPSPEQGWIVERLLSLLVKFKPNAKTTLVVFPRTVMFCSPEQELTQLGQLVFGCGGKVVLIMTFCVRVVLPRQNHCHKCKFLKLTRVLDLGFLIFDTRIIIIYNI